MTATAPWAEKAGSMRVLADRRVPPTWSPLMAIVIGAAISACNSAGGIGAQIKEADISVSIDAPISVETTMHGQCSFPGFQTNNRVYSYGPEPSPVDGWHVSVDIELDSKTLEPDNLASLDLRDDHGDVGSYGALVTPQGREAFTFSASLYPDGSHGSVPPGVTGHITFHCH